MNPLIRAAALVFTFMISTSIVRAAEWEGVFEGTLGRSKIIVQLVEPLDDMEAETKRETSRYSYLPRARDINLMLTAKNGELHFDETLLQPYEFRDESTSDKKITGRWVLHVMGNSAKGEWTSVDRKKKLTISLSRVPRISAEEAGPDRNIDIATYDELWAKSLRFTDSGPAKTFGSIGIWFVKDSAFGITFPVLGAFPDGGTKVKANAALLAAHHRSVVQYRECKNSVPMDWQEADGPPDFSNDVVYASSTVLTFVESGSVFCGGAYPDNFVKPITYDLADGVQMGGAYALDLSPNGFGRALKLGDKSERIAFEHFAMDRWKASAARDKEMGGDCNSSWDEVAPDGEHEFSLSFTDKGLAVRRTDYPNAASVCLDTSFNPTIVPWNELKPWLKQDQKLLLKEIQ